MFRTNYDPSRKIAAIIKAATLGRRIQLEYPQIAEDYRKSEFFPRDIAIKYRMPEKYGVTIDQAARSISFAIRGHSGNYGVEKYHGLIDKEELDQLGIKKNKDSGKRVRDQGLGLFGLSREQRDEARLEAVVAKGYVYWKAEEELDLSKMHKNPAYYYTTGKNRGKPNLNLIANELNLKYHEDRQVRTHSSVNLKLISIRRKQKSLLEIVLS
ncbi:hypothetical protein HYU23_03225 [Candidatus Woesearchaeota archaeon]|nr:hypothetical protein [Candidatus Woesearchaeota archaeon]